MKIEHLPIDDLKKCVVVCRQAGDVDAYVNIIIYIVINQYQ